MSIHSMGIEKGSVLFEEGKNVPPSGKIENTGP